MKKIKKKIKKKTRNIILTTMCQLLKHKIHCVIAGVLGFKKEFDPHTLEPALEQHKRLARDHQKQLKKIFKFKAKKFNLKK